MTPAEAMHQTVAGWRAKHFAAFAGASVDVRLPVTQAVLNEVLAAAVLPRVPALRRLDVTIQPGNRLDVRVASAQIRWLPSLAVPVRVLPGILPGPRVRLELVSGGLAATLAPLAGRLGQGHLRGVHIDGSSVEIDLPTLLPPFEAQTLAIWFDQGAIHTEPGVIWVSGRLAMHPTTSSPAQHD